jgi:hypothetical protein
VEHTFFVEGYLVVVQVVWGQFVCPSLAKQVDELVIVGGDGREIYLLLDEI